LRASGAIQANEEVDLSEYDISLFDPSLTWKDIDWLRTVTKLPIIIKGILTGYIVLTLISLISLLPVCK
jgi:(S)-2-hydroxy-acid oxidase